MKKITLTTALLCLCAPAWSQLFLTLPASADCPIVYHDNYPSANQNYANTAFLAAYEIPGTQGGVNTNRALIDFDLSQIPIGSTVLSAKLNLYAYTDFTIFPLQDGHYGNNQSILSRITSNWNESVVTWNTQPLFSNVNETTLNQSTSPSQDYLNINVTALVQDMVDNPNSSFGFRLALVNEAVTSSLSFCSSEFPNTAKRPSLAIEYRLEDAAVQSFSFEAFELYPNPTQNMLYLNFSQDVNTRTVALYDMQGKIVLQTAAPDKTSAIDIQVLNTGIYTIVVKDEMAIYRTEQFHKF
jgi:hypothetical protein